MAPLRLVGKDGRPLEAPPRPLSDEERAEAERLGTFLTEAPASCFRAGELVWLTTLVVRFNGVATIAQLEHMRRLAGTVERRQRLGWWLDPLAGDAETAAPGPDARPV